MYTKEQFIAHIMSLIENEIVFSTDLVIPRSPNFIIRDGEVYFKVDALDNLQMNLKSFMGRYSSELEPPEWTLTYERACLLGIAEWQEELEEVERDFGGDTAPEAQERVFCRRAIRKIESFKDRARFYRYALNFVENN